ncbi:hypothetical protein [Caballeronia sp.]|uniref:hypothetical protein n=1 Tax=Caballeronia sp. TaxID=1931223 RepID=UPI003C36858C
MNAPLIVVQGDLLLPTMYPMASMPFAAFGEEWILNGTRPALTEYEIPFYAARFITAYISGLTSRDDRFPYTPSSLWGNFKRNDPVDQSELRHAANLTPEVAEPPPFAFEPFTAPDEHRAIVPPPNDRRKQVAGGAIALACAAFIAWALFGTKFGHHADLPLAPQLALNTPAPATNAPAKPEPVTATPASDATVASAQEVAPVAVVAALPVLAAKPVADAAPAPAPVRSKPAEQLAMSSRQPLAAHVATESIARARPLAQTPARDESIAKTKPRATTRIKHEAHRYGHVHRRHGYQGEPVYRSSGHAEPLAAPGRRAVASDSNRASSYSSPSIPEMYNMLAHSAVLDDNSGGSRAAPRAIARQPADVPPLRGGSADVGNSNVDLSQRRITDAPSQFSK